MAKLGTFGSLDFIPIECSHDKLIIMSQLKSYSLPQIMNPLFKGYNFDTIDISSGLCQKDDQKPSVLYKATNQFCTHNPGQIILDEFGIVRLMFLQNNKTYKVKGNYAPRKHLTELLKNHAPSKLIPMSVLTRNEVSVPKNTVKKYTNPKIRYYVTQPTNIFMGYFPKKQKNKDIMLKNMIPNSNDAYFVCDSAIKLIRDLSIAKNISKYNIHCMFSSATFGDPSSLQYSGSKNLLMRTASCTKYTHTYNIPMNKEKGDPISLLPQPVTHKIIKGTTVSKTIKGNPAMTFKNARVETTIKKIKTKIKSTTDPKVKLWYSQAKRLGDHEQVAFAKWLMDNANLPDKESTIIKSSQPKKVTSKIKLDCNKNNVFLVTQDWPCFCYAVYNQINSIISIKGAYIVAKF